jgi:hypothetical protein
MVIVLFAAASGGSRRNGRVKSGAKAKAPQQEKRSNKAPIAAEPQNFLHRYWARLLNLDHLGKLLTVIVGIATVGGYICSRIAFFGGADNTRQPAPLSPVAPSSPVIPISMSIRSEGNHSPTIAGGRDVHFTNVDHQIIVSDPVASEAENEAWRLLVEIFDRSEDMRRMMARVIPIENGGIKSARKDVPWLKGLLQRAVKPEVRSALERAAKVYIETIVELADQGLAYPPFKDPKAIDVRIGVLLDAYKKLTAASEGVRGTRAYYTLLHGRFMLSHAIRAIAQNANVSLAEALQCANAVREEIRQHSDKDGLLGFDAIGFIFVEGEPKRAYVECSNALEHLPWTILCEADSLALRFHLLRLESFAAFFKQVLESKSPAGADLAWIIDRQRGGEVDASLEYVAAYESGFPPEQQSYRNMANGWIDTILVKYAELSRMHNGAALWDTKRVGRRIIAQVSKSESLVRELDTADEVSPDFLYPSVCVHFEAAQVWNPSDKAGLKELLQVGDKLASRLSNDEHLLHTPLRTGQPALDRDQLSKLAAMRDFFKRRLAELK